jgi:hypothetical protein
MQQLDVWALFDGIGDGMVAAVDGRYKRVPLENRIPALIWAFSVFRPLRTGFHGRRRRSSGRT